MAEQPSSDPSSPISPAPSPVEPLKPRRRRHWLKWVGGFLLILILLVVFAPTILSTAPARSMVLSRVNGMLNGRVEVTDWSLGWRSGTRISGVRVFNANNSQILQLKSLTTDLTLLNALRGKLHLGIVRVEGLDALIKTDAEGVTDFEKLPKRPTAAPSSPPPTSPAPASPTPAKDEPPTKLPDLSGELHLVNCSATYEDGRSAANGGTGQTFYFPSIAGVVKVPDINGSISNALEILCRVGQQQSGKITLAGDIDAIENNVIDIDKLTASEKVNVQGFEAASIEFLLGKDAPLSRLRGLTDGSINIQLPAQGPSTVDVRITSKKFEAGGSALKDGVYQAESVAFNLPNLVIDRPAGSDDIGKWTIRNASEKEPIALQIDEGAITIFIQSPIASLQNAAAGKAPGAPGVVRMNTSLDVGKLAKKLPALFAVREGLDLTGGRLEQKLDIAMLPDRTDIKTLEVHLTDVAGTDTVRKTNVALKPIHLTSSGTLGGSGLYDLRNLKVAIQSGFAQVTVGGPTADSISGKLEANVQQARDELSQILDLSGTILAAADVPGKEPTLRLTSGHCVIGFDAAVVTDVSQKTSRIAGSLSVKGDTFGLQQGPVADKIAEATVGTKFSYGAPNPSTDAAAPPALFTGVFRDLRIENLDVLFTRGPKPIVKLALAEPLWISDPAAAQKLFASLSDPKTAPADVPDLVAALKGNGDLAELMALLDTLGGTVNKEQPYTGAYALDQRITAGKGGVSSVGSINLADLIVKSEAGSVSEKSVQLANDITLDLGGQTLYMRRVDLKMEATRALEIALKGTLHSFSTTRTFKDVDGTLTYDWAKLWTLVSPLIDKETFDPALLKVKGQGSGPFAFEGNLPVDKPFNESIRGLTGGLQLNFEEINYKEMVVQKLELPVMLKDGQAVIAYRDKPDGSNIPPAAPFNSGLLRLGGAWFDLTDPVLRLNMVKDTRLLENVGSPGTELEFAL